MRTIKTTIAAFAMAAAAFAALALADVKVIDDQVKETAKLKAKPFLDIRKAKAAHTKDDLLLHTVTMRGQIRPEKSNERAIILINTKGSRTSEAEYVVLNRRVLRIKNDQVTKAGAATPGESRRTWKYRFKAETIGNPESYGWAALTVKGSTRDLAPSRRYAIHKLP